MMPKNINAKETHISAFLILPPFKESELKGNDKKMERDFRLAP
jgi:hypothetical protein